MSKYWAGQFVRVALSQWRRYPAKFVKIIAMKARLSSLFDSLRTGFLFVTFLHFSSLFPLFFDRIFCLNIHARSFLSLLKKVKYRKKELFEQKSFSSGSIEENMSLKLDFFVQIRTFPRVLFYLYFYK